MKPIETQYPKVALPINLPQLSNGQTCFLDIETTGFDRIHHHIIILGCMVVHDDHLNMKQWFASTPLEEKGLLLEFLEFINYPTHLVTFNGDRFDLPFIAARLAYHHLFKSKDEALTFLLSNMLHTDLYQIVRMLNLPGLENSKLKSIEKLLGIDRSDTISGKESISLFHQYCSNHNPEIFKKIMLHNADDIANMYPLWSINRYTHNSLQPFVMAQVAQTTNPFLWSAKIDYRKDEPVALIVEGICNQHLNNFWHGQGHQIETKHNKFKMRLLLNIHHFQGQTLTLINASLFSSFAKVDLRPSKWVIKQGNQWLDHQIALSIEHILKEMLDIFKK